MMLEITVRVTAPWDPIGAKERIAADLERYGDVRVVSVRETGAGGGEQMGLFQRRRTTAICRSKGEG